MQNPLEVSIESVLTELNIRFEREGLHRLDFFLPDFNTYIEVKEYHTDRVNQQLKDHAEVILVQGKQAVETFCKLLKGTI